MKRCAQTTQPLGDTLQTSLMVQTPWPHSALRILQEARELRALYALFQLARQYETSTEAMSSFLQPKIRYLNKCYYLLRNLLTLVGKRHGSMCRLRRC